MELSEVWRAAGDARLLAMSRMKVEELMKTRRWTTALGYPALGAFLLAASAPRVSAHDRDGRGNHERDKKQVNALVKVVREATAKYRDVTLAEADGYALQFGCVTGGDVGAMGLHYVNGPLVMDGLLDATRPEIVIYEPTPDGGRRLVGADYLVLADAWHATHASPPELMGQLLHLFEAPNRFGLPAFYTLHVWAWKENPTGTFVNWHSNVSCDSFAGE
jgi:hypothetical protein